MQKIKTVKKYKNKYIHFYIIFFFENILQKLLDIILY